MTSKSFESNQNHKFIDQILVRSQEESLFCSNDKVSSVSFDNDTYEDALDLQESAEPNQELEEIF